MNEILTPLHHKTYTLRGKQIMLDSDLAELYEVDIKRLNEQEYDSLRSQFMTLDKGIGKP